MVGCDHHEPSPPRVHTCTVPRSPAFAAEEECSIEIQNSKGEKSGEIKLKSGGSVTLGKAELTCKNGELTVKPAPNAVLPPPNPFFPHIVVPIGIKTLGAAAITSIKEPEEIIP